MSSFPEILQALRDTSAAFDEFKTANNKRISELKSENSALLDRVEELESRRQKPNTSPTAPGLTFKTADGSREFPVLRRGELLTDRVKAPDDFDLGEFVYGQVIGGNSTKASSGPALVDSVLSLRVIDAIRANAALAQAGVPTIVVSDGGTVMGRITGDPTAYAHTEGANDISASDVSVDAVTLKPAAIVIRLPLTNEVVSDSPNLTSLLELSCSAAIAQKADSLGLATLAADSDMAESASGEDPASWVSTLAAVGSALGADVPFPTAHVGSEADFIARAGEQASTAGSWLGRPPALQDMRELFTTKIAAGTAYLGRFDLALVMAVRQAIRFEVVRFASPGTYSHELIVHARLDFVVTQPAALYRQLKTVS